MWEKFKIKYFFSHFKTYFCCYQCPKCQKTKHGAKMTGTGNFKGHSSELRPSQTELSVSIDQLELASKISKNPSPRQPQLKLPQCHLYWQRGRCQNAHPAVKLYYQRRHHLLPESLPNDEKPSHFQYSNAIPPPLILWVPPLSCRVVPFQEFEPKAPDCKVGTFLHHLCG